MAPEGGDLGIYMGTKGSTDLTDLTLFLTFVSLLD